MKIQLSELQRMAAIDKVIIRSFECSVYQAFAIIDGQERLIYENAQHSLCRRNTGAIKEALASLPISRLQLQQQSAFDEMIGQPPREGSNMLELPLSAANTD